MKYMVVVVDDQNVPLDTWVCSDKTEARYKLQQDFLMMTHLMNSTITECSITNEYAKMVFDDNRFIEWFVCELSKEK